MQLSQHRRARLKENIGKGTMQQIASFNRCEGISHYLFLAVSQASLQYAWV